jgi:hypothetical protein
MTEGIQLAAAGVVAEITVDVALVRMIAPGWVAAAVAAAEVVVAVEGLVSFAHSAD